MSSTSEPRDRVQPEVLLPSDGLAAAVGPDTPPIGTDGAADDGEQVTQPTKLIRIASMVRSMLDEVRRAPLDDAGRRRLREIHDRSIEELDSVLSPDLRDELARLALPFLEETAPSDAELRIAHAQLVGWLEGLFHGIQATLFTQQAMAQSQLEEVRRRRAIDMAQPGGQAAPPSGYL